MNFPLTRHDQRYEYLLRMGYVKDRIVIDVGCGENAYGTAMLSAEARMVIGVDPTIKADVNNMIWSRSTNHSRADRIKFCIGKVEELTVEGPTEDSVIVCVEVFEHVTDPRAFIKHTSSLAKWGFYTTPLAGVTGKTRNPEHVCEYSHVDFMRVLSEYYHVRDVQYQLGDMSIVKDAKANGDSHDEGHVVQMAWCERR